MLIVSALLLGMIIGFIIGSMATAKRMFGSIQNDGFMEYKSKLYLIREVNIKDFKERLTEDYLRVGWIE